MLKRNRVVAQDFFWRWSFESVFAGTPVRFCVWVQRQAQVSVLADAANESGSGRQAFQENLIGIAAINGNEKLALQSIGALIERIAEIDERRKPDLSKRMSFLVFLIVLLIVWIIIEQMARKRYIRKLRMLKKNAEMKIIG